MSDVVEIPKEKYAKLMRDVRKLEALELAGVDNWDFYDDALREWFKEHEIDELVEGFIENLNDILAEADVEEPAGRGCGHVIHYDVDTVTRFLVELCENYHKIQDDK